MGFDKDSIETKRVDPGRRLRALADAACKDHGFDHAEAALVALIEADADLVTYAVRATARDEIRMAMAVRRQRILGAAETLDEKREGKGGGGRPKEYAREVADKVREWGGRYLAWPLSSRKLLGEATVEDVKAEAEMYEASAQGNARNGRFMRLVQKRLVTLKVKPGEAVGKVLSDSVLEHLMAKAQAE